LDVRILFVGNSYTLRNDLPGLLAKLAAAARHPRHVHVETIFAGGASLRRHWNAGRVQRSLQAAHWDYVVLQEQSTLPVKNAQRYHEHVRLFAPEIVRHGARVVLYVTWSRQSAPQSQAIITDAVKEIAAEVDALVVPVGVAWHEAIRQDPEVRLYAEDGSHPTAAGSYLAACVFHVALFHEAVNDETVAESLKIDRDTARRLQTIAWACRD
jgi:hypothetical protein